MGLKERGKKKPGNKTVIKRDACLATGRYGVDPCHFPYRRSEVHDDGMLFLIPLVREWHTLVDNYEEPYRSMVERLARSFHRRKIEGWKAAGLYLGPEWRIREVENGE